MAICGRFRYAKSISSLFFVSQSQIPAWYPGPYKISTPICWSVVEYGSS